MLEGWTVLHLFGHLYPCVRCDYTTASTKNQNKELKTLNRVFVIHHSLKYKTDTIVDPKTFGSYYCLFETVYTTNSNKTTEDMRGDMIITKQHGRLPIQNHFKTINIHCFTSYTVGIFLFELLNNKLTTFGGLQSLFLVCVCVCVYHLTWGGSCLGSPLARH